MSAKKSYFFRVLFAEMQNFSIWIRSCIQFFNRRHKRVNLWEGCFFKQPFFIENRSDEFFLHQSSDREILIYRSKLRFRYLAWHKNNLIIDDFMCFVTMLLLRCTTSHTF